MQERPQHKLYWMMMKFTFYNMNSKSEVALPSSIVPVHFYYSCRPAFLSELQWSYGVRGVSESQSIINKAEASGVSNDGMS